MIFEYVMLNGYLRRYVVKWPKDFFDSSHHRSRIQKKPPRTDYFENKET